MPSFDDAADRFTEIVNDLGGKRLDPNQEILRKLANALMFLCGALEERLDALDGAVARLHSGRRPRSRSSPRG